MNASAFELILYVEDQQVSTKFYSAILNRQPDLNVPGMTEFVLTNNLKLGLMPEAGIAKILLDKTPHPSLGNGIPRCELYIYVENIEEVFMTAKEAGAKEISNIQQRDWGDVVGYLSDSDGHILALAKRSKGI
jgi:hypothetical protein